MEKVRYEEMLPHEIVTRRRTFPAAFIGLGGLEWHGEHLAVGNDALKAEKLCELAAARSGGFAFPTLWYGEARTAGLMEANHDKGGRIKACMGFQKRKFLASHFPTTPEEQIALHQQLLRHVLVQMNTLEMKAVCLVCGHYPIYSWARPVVRAFNRACPDTKAFAGTEFHYPRRSRHVGIDHAAKWESSYLAYLRPDCADMSVYVGRRDRTLVGLMGEDPRGVASVEIGRRACNLIVDAIVRKARTLLRAAPRPRVRRGA